MDLKEQARALELLRNLVAFGKQIDETTIRELESGELSDSERATLFSALGWMSFWADMGKIFLSLETSTASDAAFPVQLIARTVAFHCGVGAREGAGGWECVKCGAIFKVSQ